MQMTGIDLNPVAWFVCKNELAGSDPKQVEALFAEIEKEVKPQIQPFYTTTCPRGHKGKWIDIRTNLAADIDPITLPPEDRKNYRWEGPEVIYTFWSTWLRSQNSAVQESGRGTENNVYYISGINLSGLRRKIPCRAGRIPHGPRRRIYLYR